MSDPVTNVEIEDVLSSIRRLVSQEGQARPAPIVEEPEPPVEAFAPADEALVEEPVEALVLTADHRVDRVAEEAAASIAGAEEVRREAASAVRSELERAIEELEAAMGIAGQKAPAAAAPEPQQAEPEGPAEEALDWDAPVGRAVDIDWEAPVGRAMEGVPPAFDAPTPPAEATAEAPWPLEQEDASVEEFVASGDEGVEEDLSSELTETVEDSDWTAPDAESEPEIDVVEHEGVMALDLAEEEVSEADTVAEAAHEEPQAEEFQTEEADAEVELEVAETAAQEDASFLEASEPAEEAEPEEDAMDIDAGPMAEADETPLETEELGALADAEEQAPAAEAPPLRPFAMQSAMEKLQLVSVGRASTYDAPYDEFYEDTGGDDPMPPQVEAQLADKADAFIAPEPPYDTARDDPYTAADLEEDAEAEQVVALDEDQLRDMVADIVRQELQGELGERITRNVRKLVRREINRALAGQDLI